jgi:hypothetical protein
VVFGESNVRANRRAAVGRLDQGWENVPRTLGRAKTSRRSVVPWISIGLGISLADMQRSRDSHATATPWKLHKLHSHVEATAGSPVHVQSPTSRGAPAT